MTRAIVRVALDTPLRRLFDYLPVRDGRRAATRRARARALRPPASHRSGAFLGRRSEVPREKLKPLLEVIDDEPVIDAGVMELVEFAAQYYHHPIGEVLAAALPKLARTGAAVARAHRTLVRERIRARGARRRRAESRAPQRELLGILRDEPGIPAESLAERLADWRTPMRALVARGFVSSAQVPDESGGSGCPAAARARARHSATSRPPPWLPSTVPPGNSRPSCCMASPAAARPRCTCTRSSTRCGADGAPWCWCPRSGSRRSSWRASARASR